MPKDAYYFSHDSNARNDIKIKALRKKYGIDGYGKYWIIIEYMRESDNYKLPYKQYTFDALADEFNMCSTDVEQFINECIATFELFIRDDEHFYSLSLIRRMNKLDNKREKNRLAGLESAKARAKRTNVEQTLNECSTIKVNKSKVNKKENNIYIVEQIVNHLNEKANTNYRTTTPKTKKVINARLNEGFSIEDFKAVINNKCQRWLNTDQAIYLRPETLFGPKFEGYLNESNHQTSRVFAQSKKQLERGDKFSEYQRG